MSMKSMLLDLAPVALVIVSLPSVTLTVAVPVTQRLAEVGLPLTTSVPSAAMR